MSGAASDDATDLAWEQWGRRDPYFSILTAQRFRRDQMTAEAMREFFRSGELHVQVVFEYIRHFIDPNFTPSSVLDFGCGVGRTLIPFATRAAQATGLDVSPSMLQEARRNCFEHGRDNVQLLVSDDELSLLTNSFDLIHSSLVFQHIPVARGRAIFGRLMRHLQPGGVGAIQVTYARSRFASTYGVPPLETLPLPPASLQAMPVANAAVAADMPAAPGCDDPEMQMNPYNLSEILFSVQQAGVQRLHLDFTDHGGELGVFLFFQRPVSTAAQQPPL